VLAWPRSIGERLTDPQVEAILAHELCHAYRRDNFAAAIHMFVEAFFWFHPLVWWIETRLVDERERACDEAVLRLGSEPQVYADSILKTCEFYVESPLVCVAGVTGSDLKKRIETIIRNDPGERLNSWRKMLLAVAGIAAFVVPTVVGALNPSQLRAQSPAANIAASTAFEVTSVKVNTSGDRSLGNDANVHISRSAGGICSPWGWIGAAETCFQASNIALRDLIAYAYGPSGLVPPRPQIFNIPSQIDADHFDVVGRAAGNDRSEPFGDPQLIPMVRTLLADRFKLALHHESKTLPIYQLVFAKADRRTGPRLRPATADCVAKVEALRTGRGNAPPRRDPCLLESGRGYLKGGAIDMQGLAWVLSNRLNRVVRNQTGLAGMFEIDFTWDDLSGAPHGSSVSSALQEQLGLKLESADGPVDVLVIDYVERPKNN
jgi:uncharacterized protein (TIGR03435 family)